MNLQIHIYGLIKQLKFEYGHVTGMKYGKDNNGLIIRGLNRQLRLDDTRWMRRHVSIIMIPHLLF